MSRTFDGVHLNVAVVSISYIVCMSYHSLDAASDEDSDISAHLTAARGRAPAAAAVEQKRTAATAPGASAPGASAPGASAPGVIEPAVTAGTSAAASTGVNTTTTAAKKVCVVYNTFSYRLARCCRLQNRGSCGMMLSA